MKKTTILLTAILFTAAFVAAETNESEEELDIEVQDVEEDLPTGWFTPDSSLYGLEVAFDNAAMGLGLSNADNVLEKRMNEATVMSNQGNSEAAERAINNSVSAASSASENATANAQETLQGVLDNAPEEAQQGLQNAMDNVERAGAPEHAGTNQTEANGNGQDEAPANGQDEAPANGQDEVNETDQPQPNGNQTDEAEESPEETSENQTEHVIENEGQSFVQDEITVEQGEEVEITFANTQGQHNLVFTDLEDVGTETLDAGERETISHTFEEEGEYTFECTLHGGMEGTVTVE